MKSFWSRRNFLVGFGVVFAGRPWGASALWSAERDELKSAGHPVPRRGITAVKVLRREQLADAADAIPAFDMVREIPEVIDGIRCTCGCAELEVYYSLLSCFEGPDGMAKHCEICQGQGRLAYRMHKSGKSLDQIRKGIDARFR